VLQLVLGFHGLEFLGGHVEEMAYRLLNSVGQVLLDLCEATGHLRLGSDCLGLFQLLQLFAGGGLRGFSEALEKLYELRVFLANLSQAIVRLSLGHSEYVVHTPSADTGLEVGSGHQQVLNFIGGSGSAPCLLFFCHVLMISYLYQWLQACLLYKNCTGLKPFSDAAFRGAIHFTVQFLYSIRFWDDGLVSDTPALPPTFKHAVYTLSPRQTKPFMEVRERSERGNPR